MPQYETDSIDAWMSTTIVAYVSSVDDTNTAEVVEKWIDAMEDIKDFLVNTVVPDELSHIPSLQKAILNTVDWVQVKSDVFESLGFTDYIDSKIEKMLCLKRMVESNKRIGSVLR
jgi:hypothetical protein